MSDLKKKRLSVYRNVITYRKDTMRINASRMHVAFPVGEYYVYKKKDGYFFSTKELLKEKEHFLFKRNVTPNFANGHSQLYVNTRNMFDNKPIAVTTFECEGGYFVTKSTKFEEENFLRQRVVYDKSGHIGNNNSLHILTKDIKVLKEKGDVFICKLHTGSYVYLEFFCVSKEAAKNYKTWQNLYYERMNLRTFDGCLTFKVTFQNNEIRLPFDFLDKEKIKKQSFLKTSIAFNIMKVELDPVICDLTNREIDRSKEKVYTYRVSKGTRDCIKVLSTQMDPTKSVKESLSDIKQSLTKDEKTFIQTLSELYKVMKTTI